MKRAFYPAMVALAAMASTGVAAQTKSSTIPSAFRGDWYEEPNETCVADGGLLLIDGKGFTLPASVATSVEVARLNALSIRVTMNETGGETGSPVVRSVANWTLSKDLRELTIADQGPDAAENTPSKFYRCVSGAKR